MMFAAASPGVDVMHRGKNQLLDVLSLRAALSTELFVSANNKFRSNVDVLFSLCNLKTV